MTKKEKIIATGFTGINFNPPFSDFVVDASKRLGRPIFTHNLVEALDEIKEAYTEDFLKMCQDETT